MAIIGFASRENLRELNEEDMMNILLYAWLNGSKTAMLHVGADKRG